MNLGTVMSFPVHTARRNTLVRDVVSVMTEHRISAVPIVDDDQKVVGLVTVSDLVPQVRNAPASNVPLLSLLNEYVDFASLDAAYERIAGLHASDVMQKTVLTGRPEVEVGTAALWMAERNLSALPIVRADGVLVGIVTRSDLMRMTIERRGE
jgi:CBS-domain-containing membrane protein